MTRSAADFRPVWSLSLPTALVTFFFVAGCDDSDDPYYAPTCGFLKSSADYQRARDLSGELQVVWSRSTGRCYYAPSLVDAIGLCKRRTSDCVMAGDSDYLWWIDPQDAALYMSDVRNADRYFQENRHDLSISMVPSETSIGAPATGPRPGSPPAPGGVSGLSLQADGKRLPACLGFEKRDVFTRVYNNCGTTIAIAPLEDTGLNSCLASRYIAERYPGDTSILIPEINNATLLYCEWSVACLNAINARRPEECVNLH